MNKPTKKTKKCIIFYAFTSKGKIHGVACGKWTCKICRKQNSRLWAWRALLQIEGSPNEYWCWTLTLGSKYKTRKQGYDDLKKLWDNLRKVISRKVLKGMGNVGKKWTYLAFVEEQPKQRKMPHFHILTNVKAPYRIKDFAVHNGFGFEATEKPVDSKKAAHYVAKYTSKGDPDMPKNFRRVRASQNWAKLPPYDGDKLIVRRNGELLTAYLLRVAEATDTDIDDLYDQWKLMHELDIE